MHNLHLIFRKLTKTGDHITWVNLFSLFTHQSSHRQYWRVLTWSVHVFWVTFVGGEIRVRTLSTVYNIMLSIWSEVLVFADFVHEFNLYSSWFQLLKRTWVVGMSVPLVTWQSAVLLIVAPTLPMACFKKIPIDCTKAHLKSEVLTIGKILPIMNCWSMKKNFRSLGTFLREHTSSLTK